MEIATRPMLVDLAWTFVCLAAWTGLGGWWPRRLSAARALDVLLRSTLGLAVTVLLLCGAAAMGLTWAGWLLAAAGTAGWAAWWRSGRQLTVSRPGGGQRAAWAMLVAAGVPAVLLATMAIHNPLPHGFDPSFHSLLIESTRQSGGIVTSWLPFEDVQVNYPFGFHQVAAAVCRMGGGTAPSVFWSLQVWMLSWQTALMAALSWRWWRRPESAWLGAGIYLALANFSSPWSYVTWGGMPTVFAMILSLAVIILSLRRHTFVSAAAVGVLLAGLIYVHHLASLILALVLGANLALAFVRRARGEVRWWMAAVGVQVLLVSPYLLWYTAKAASLAETNVTRFQNEARIGLVVAVSSLGMGLLVAALLGAWGLRRQVVGPRRLTLLACWLGVCAFAWIALDWGYRAWLLQREGVDATAFTPSRFLSQLVYPLALLGAGGLIVKVAQHRASQLVMAVATAILIAWNAWQSTPPLPEWADRIDLYRRVKHEVPPNGMVLYFFPASAEEMNWQAYFSWHPAIYTPLPASEPRSHQTVTDKDLFAKSGNLADLWPWLNTRDLRLFLLMPARQASSSDSRLQVVASWDDYVVYELLP